MYDEIPTEITPFLDSSNHAVGALAGAALALVIVGALIVLALVVLIIVANCKMFKKAGEDWWKALVPLYNSWVEARIGGLAWWWFLIFVRSSVNLVDLHYYVHYYHLLDSQF